MINIKVNYDGKGTESNCEVHIEGRKAAVCEFYAVLKSLSKCDNEVLTDALEMLVNDKFDEMLKRGEDNDKSES